MTPQGVCAIALGDAPEPLIGQLKADFPQASSIQETQERQPWAEEVLALVEAPQKAIGFPLDIQGTAFRQQVWQTLQTIPPGTTLSYREVATQIGKPGAVRAVAQACAKNTLAIAIPCHRVVGSDGSLRGYRWGRDRKQALLKREAEALILQGVTHPSGV